MLGGTDAAFQLFQDILADLVFDGEQIGEGTIETERVENPSALDVHKTRIDPDDVAATQDAAFKEIVESGRCVAGAGRIVVPNGQVRHLRQIGQDRVRNPARQIVLGRIAAGIDKRRHPDGDAVLRLGARLRFIVCRDFRPKNAAAVSCDRHGQECENRNSQAPRTARRGAGLASSAKVAPISSHRRNQAVSAFRDRLDVSRIARVVRQRPPDLDDGGGERIVADMDIRPDLLEQFVAADHFARDARSDRPRSPWTLARGAASRRRERSRSYSGRTTQSPTTISDSAGLFLSFAQGAFRSACSLSVPRRLQPTAARVIFPVFQRDSKNIGKPSGNHRDRIPPPGLTRRAPCGSGAKAPCKALHGPATTSWGNDRWHLMQKLQIDDAPAMAGCGGSLECLGQAAGRMAGPGHRGDAGHGRNRQGQLGSRCGRRRRTAIAGRGTAGRAYGLMSWPPTSRRTSSTMPRRTPVSRA